VTDSAGVRGGVVVDGFWAHNARTVPKSSRWTAALQGGALFVAIVTMNAACHSAAPPIAGVPDQVDFNFHVKPILSDRCFKCHGPDERQRKGGLRLDVKDAAFATLESGHRAIVAGSTSKSELVRRITSTDPKVMMPAPESHLALDEVEKATLIRWIEQGAEWKPHWSFIPPVTPAVPAVRTSGWPRGEIDRFVLAALEAKGWKPSPEAPRETWLRRVSFDLTGLPPTPAAIDAFLADRAPDAYERVVDRLLAAPAYGERMAADWLDIARYADSHGYQDDGMREMWPWRDWVISAFNRNLRVDDFITWQLAGDLLPDATQEQRIATGFNRNHMQSQEGGIVAEEYRTEYVVDRVNTLGRAVLGLSVECARCHDHKYDPISQREFYRLYAFFNNVNEVGQIPYSGVPSPTTIVTTPAVDAKLAALAARIATLEAELDPAAATYDTGYARWLATAADASRGAIANPPGLIAHFPFEAPHPVIEPPEVVDTIQREATMITSGIQSSLAGARVAGGAIGNGPIGGPLGGGGLAPPPQPAPSPGAGPGPAAGSPSPNGDGGNGNPNPNQPTDRQVAAQDAPPDPADAGGDEESGEKGAVESAGAPVANPNVVVDLSSVTGTPAQIDTPIMSGGNSSLWQGADGVDTPGNP